MELGRPASPSLQMLTTLHNANNISLLQSMMTSKLNSAQKMTRKHPSVRPNPEVMHGGNV
jgi:hypothetical protein